MWPSVEAVLHGARGFLPPAPAPAPRPDVPLEQPRQSGRSTGSNGDRAEWARQRKKQFLPLDAETQIVVSDIMATDGALVNIKTGGLAADPWVIAVATAHKLTVISGEKWRLPKLTIPSVCAAKGVRHLSLLAMIRELGWRFE